MRLLTLLAVAALAAGVYRYRNHHRGFARRRRGRQAGSDALLEESVRSGILEIEPVGDLGPMQSGIATGV